MDKATLSGLVLAIGGILLGLMLEGGNLGQVLQPTAAMIVFGGTLGAVLIQYPSAARPHVGGGRDRPAGTPQHHGARTR